jgi:hypothetical protein
MGSIRAVDMHASGEAVVAVGLGRFAYIFDTKKRSRASLVGKVYLKQKLNAVLFSSEEKAGPKDDDDRSGNDSDATGELDDGLAEGDDEVQEGFSSDEGANDGDDELPTAADEDGKTPKAKAKKAVRRKKKRTASAMAEAGEAAADGEEDTTAATPARRRKKRKDTAA